MSQKVKNLVKRALALSDNGKRSTKTRYPQELKTIISDLIREHGLSVSKVVSLIPVSHYSVRSWSNTHLSKKTKSKAKKRTMFRKISLETKEPSGENFKGIKGVLYLMILLQVLGIIFSLSLR